MNEPSAHTRPIFHTVDIVRRHGEALGKMYPLSLDQRRLKGAMIACRTAALGGHLHYCLRCNTHHPVFHSCRKRGCTTCQALAQEKWIAARSERILPMRHFHLTFTLPSELRRLAKAHPVEIYNEFFRIVGEIIEALGLTHFGVRFGWTAVLHTWKRDMGDHPHLHVIVTAGGLLINGSAFRVISGGYLFSGEVMGELLRGKMLAALRRLFARSIFLELDEASFDELMASLARHKSWVVHAQAPLRDASHLLGYLGRYVHRIAISDSRLKEVTETSVTFSTRNGKTASMSPLTFLYRFFQHVLPSGFHKVRHGGLYANPRPGGRLDQARVLLTQIKQEAIEQKERTEEAIEKPILQGPACPICGGPMVRMNVSLPRVRAPVGGANA